MQFLILYSLSVLVTFYAAWLLRPEYVEGFLASLPMIHWSDIGLVLIITNYTILAIGIKAAFNKETRSNIALISGGLVAASTIGSLLSVSFVFNILWSAVTPKYLLLLMIGVYVVNLGGPLFIYSIKEGENNQPTKHLLNAEFLSQIKKLLAELEQFAVKNKLQTASIEKLENLTHQNNGSTIDLTLINNRLQDIVLEIQLPEPLLEKVILLQQKIKES